MKSKATLLSVISALFVSALPGHAATYYSDDFNGTVGGQLNLTSPDSRPGSQTWTANTDFVFATGGGVHSSTVAAARGAYLDFTPSAGFIYTYNITIQFDATGANTGSLQMGFINTAPSGGTIAATGSGNPVIFMRQNGSAELRAFGGSSLTSNYAKAIGTYTVTDTHIMTLVLDTSGSQWKVQGYIDNVAFGPQYTYTAGNPTIQGIGFSANNTAGAAGTFSNFTFDATSVPEPSAALLGIAAAALLSRRRRA